VKKRMIPLVLIIALAMVLVPLATAGGGGGGGKQQGKSKFNLVGTLKAVDAEGGAITVTVKSGTKTVKPYRGLDLTLVVDPSARIRVVTADGCVKAVPADLPLETKVKVRGTIDRTDPAAPLYRAKDVKVKAPVEPEPEPEPSASPAR